MADNSRIRTPMATVRDMVQFLLLPITGAVISEFAGNDPKELFNYLPTVCADKGPVLVVYFAAKECKPEPEGIFHFSVFVVAKNIAQPDLGLTEAQQALDANSVATSVYACIDHKILGNQQTFDAVSDTPLTISNGSQTTIVEHKFTMEDY